MKRFLCNVIIIPSTLALLFLGIRGDAGGDKTAWKLFLAGDTYKVLSQRSIKVIEETAKSDNKNASARIHVEAAILAGYTLSVADPKAEDVSMLRGAALSAARLAKEKDIKNLTELRKLDILAPADVKLLKARMPALDDLMEIFRNKAKGGEGLHADLHYHPKLKNLNGIEALIGALAGKKLSNENVDKVAKELPNLAYRIAVVGALTHELAPDKRAGEWHTLSNQMRDESLALADAAQKKNADGILKAAASLENSCTQCHREFKKK